MQKQDHVIAAADHSASSAAFQHAVDLVQNGAAKAATGTENVVRRHPLAAVGIALGAGVGIGVLAHRLIAAQRKPAPWFERLGTAAFIATAARGISKLF